MLITGSAVWLALEGSLNVFTAVVSSHRVSATRCTTIAHGTARHVWVNGHQVLQLSVSVRTTRQVMGSSLRNHSVYLATSTLKISAASYLTARGRLARGKC